MRSMPLVVVVHPDDRLVIANGRDKVSIRDIENYLDATMAGDRLGYAKLVDFSDCQLALSESDVLSLGAWIKAYGSAGIGLGRSLSLCALKIARSPGSMRCSPRPT